jgi:E3 ubiquitin-protein ligase RNF13
VLHFLIIECAMSIWLAAPVVKGTGVNGIVYTAEPLNACIPLTIKALKGPLPPIALIIRGGCPFDEKVRNAQDAGFNAAIVYDNENSGILVSSNLPHHSRLLRSSFA